VKKDRWKEVLLNLFYKQFYRTPTIYISPQTNPQPHIRGVKNDSVERCAFEPVFLSVYDGFTLNLKLGTKQSVACYSVLDSTLI
jgi:hypothetical protein